MKAINKYFIIIGILYCIILGKTYAQRNVAGGTGFSTSKPTIQSTYTFSGGDGSAGNPFLISNKTDLDSLSSNSAYWTDNFEQTANITFSSSDFQSGGMFYNGGAGFSPIGNGTNPFYGSYHGNGYTIDSLYINRGSTDYVGLFGELSYGLISYLGIENANITGQNYVGGLLGYTQSSTVLNCYSSGLVSGGNYVGGLVGDNNSPLSNSYSTATVSGSQYVGGLVGDNINSISNSYSIGGVTGSSDVGGFAGNNSSTVSNSFWNTDSAGTTGIGNGTTTGGIGEPTDSMKTESTFTSRGWDFTNTWSMDTTNQNVNNGYPFLYWQEKLISGSTEKAGVNLAWTDTTAKSIVSNSYGNYTIGVSNNWSGTVTPSLSGYTFIPSNRTYKADTSNQTGQNYTILLTISGNAGIAGATLSWTDTTAKTTTADGSGNYSITVSYNWSGTITPSSFTGSIFSPANRTYTADTSNQTGQNYTASYPFSGGDGSAGNPYLISDKTDLYVLSSNSVYWTKNFKQTANITFSSSDFQSGGMFYNGGTGFNPIGNGTNPFFGSYHGNGHVIDSLYINRDSTDYVGLFGELFSGLIRNLGIENEKITGYDYVGGLLGKARTSTVINCYCAGSVNGGQWVGGLVGYTYSSSISNNYSTVNVSGTSDDGGLVGENYLSSSISNSYSTGSVSGGSGVGGLVGYNTQNSSISNCYSTGNISGSSYVGGLVGDNLSTVNNSFWDNQTSSQSTSAGGTGEPTDSMKTESTFTSRGWDFGSYWAISGSVNNGYPYLFIRPMAENDTVTHAVEQTFTITTSEFHFFDADGDTLFQIKITSLPSAGTLYLDSNHNNKYDSGEEVAVGSIISKTDLDNNLLQYFPGSSAGSSFTFKVSDSTYFSTFAYTITLVGDVTVTINRQKALTNSSPVNFTVVFSNAVTGFTSGDVTLGGTAGAAIDTVTGSDSTYNVAVYGMTGYGTVTATIPAGVASSLNGVTNKASTSTDDTVTYDPAMPNGSGTVSDPYLIAKLGDLKWVSENSSSWSSYFKQTADINADSTKYWNSGAGFSPIGNRYITNFSGNYNGNGHTIDSLYISRSSTEYVGLFGYMSVGSISNLGIENENITGSSYVGGLVGWSASSTVENCYSTGLVSSTSGVGGLVGINYTSASISNSYSTGGVSGSSVVGGLVGGNVATISNSYSIGSVSGSSYVGGFAGENGGTVSNSFWDTDSAGTTGIGYGTTTGATGEPTDSMKTESIFTSRGWDFTSTWSISLGKNNGYPYLQSVTPLPVELTTFTASTKGNTVILNWNTATEVNCYGFDIQRASVISNEERNLTWTKVGFVKGAGTSNSPKSYSFIDTRPFGENPVAGKAEYRLKQIDNNGSFKYSKVINVQLKLIPKEFTLYQNYPNPFNPSTNLKYSLPYSSHVMLTIYNTLGQRVKVLIDKIQSAGYYNYQWNANEMASGVYICVLDAVSTNGKQNYQSIKKMVLLK